MIIEKRIKRPSKTAVEFHDIGNGDNDTDDDE